LLGLEVSAQMNARQFENLSLEEMILICEDTSQSTQEFLSIAYKKAEELEDAMSMARIELFQSRDALMNKNLSAALKFALSAKQKIEGTTDEEINARCYKRIALALEEIGAFQEAIKYRKLQRDFLEKKGLPRKSAYLNNFIGDLFGKIDNLDSARYYYKIFLARSLETKDERRISFCRNNIGLTYLHSGLIDSSILEFERALEYYKTDPRKDGRIMLSTIYGNLSYAYMKKKDYARSLELVDLSYSVAKEMALKTYYTRAIYFKARVLNEKGDYRGSNRILNKISSEDRNDQFFNKEELLLLLDIESSNYESLGNNAKALELSKQHIELYEKLYGKERLDELYLLRSNFQSLEIHNELKLEQVISEKRGEQIG